MEKYLPIGTVVTVKGNTKKLMIIGRLQKDVQEEKIWDYSACLYPEGHIAPDKIMLFQHESIDQIFALGYRNEEEFKFLTDYLDGQGLNI